MDSNPMIVGRSSGIDGQLSERSDALAEVLQWCPNWVKFFPSSLIPFSEPQATSFPREDAAPFGSQTSRLGRPQMG
jgi:hypothetical protein